MGIVFFYPYAVNFRQLGRQGLIVVLMFVGFFLSKSYFRLIWAMYFKEGDCQVEEHAITPAFKGALALTASWVIILGV